MYRLRKATAADTEFLRQLHHAAYRDVVTRMFGWDDAKQDRYFSSGFDATAYQVIIYDQQEIGAIRVQRDTTRWFLAEIQLLPAFHGHGIGTAVVHDLLVQAQAQRCSVSLQILKENRARRLYERLGFTLTGETETHYLMERSLTQGDE